MISINRILFPVDFSERSCGAAHAVRAVARRFQAEVTPLHVVEGSSRSDREGVYQAMETLVANELSGCKVSPCIVTGDPAERILEQARGRRFGLIMMPTHGHGPFRRYLLGSVTAKVLHDAACPVWTSAHLENWPAIENIALRRILCAIDFGPRNAAALECAARVTAEFGANLTLTHVIPLYESQAWRRRMVTASEERARMEQRELGISAAVEILEGTPAAALSEAAERLDADLMVIGRTHIVGEAKIGMNAYTIIAHSPCPVLSV
jgi:nucleotide-binding universal stress UspA family protein